MPGQAAGLWLLSLHELSGIPLTCSPVPEPAATKVTSQEEAEILLTKKICQPNPLTCADKTHYKSWSRFSVNFSKICLLETFLPALIKCLKKGEVENRDRQGDLKNA